MKKISLSYLFYTGICMSIFLGTEGRVQAYPACISIPGATKYAIHLYYCQKLNSENSALTADKNHALALAKQKSCYAHAKRYLLNSEMGKGNNECYQVYLSQATNQQNTCEGKHTTVFTSTREIKGEFRKTVFSCAWIELDVKPRT